MSKVSRSQSRGDTSCECIIAQYRPVRVTFDHEGLVANAGLVVPATLMARLGIEALIDGLVRTGSARPGRKILTVVAAILAGATHIDHVGMLRAGATGRVLPFKPLAASTVGTFLRTSRLVMSVSLMRFVLVCSLLLGLRVLDPEKMHV
jgi:hypothetical protein